MIEIRYVLFTFVFYLVLTHIDLKMLSMYM